MNKKKKLGLSLLISLGLLLVTTIAGSGGYRACGESTSYTFSLFGQEIIKSSSDNSYCVGGSGSDWQGFPLPVKERVLAANPTIQDSAEDSGYSLLGISGNFLLYFLISYGLIELIAHSRKLTVS